MNYELGVVEKSGRLLMQLALNKKNDGGKTN